MTIKESKDHLRLCNGSLDAFNGDNLGSYTARHNKVASLRSGGEVRFLTADECEHLGNFLLDAAKQARDAKERARNLADERLCSASNVCKSCGHVNEPSKRGTFGCEHCGAWVTGLPFPSAAIEQNAPKEASSGCVVVDRRSNPPTVHDGRRGGK